MRCFGWFVVLLSSFWLVSRVEPGGTAAAETSWPACRVSPPFTLISDRFIGFIDLRMPSTFLSDEQKRRAQAASIPIFCTTGPEPNGSATRAAWNGYAADVAAGIRAGQLDMATLQQDYDAMDRATAADDKPDADVGNSLHALLTAAQRTALVNAIRVENEQEKAQVRATDASEATRTRRAKLQKSELDFITQLLGLSAVQQQQVDELLTSYPEPSVIEARTRRVDQLLAAFVQDSFDATKFDLSAYGPETPHGIEQQDVAYLRALLPILTPAQRETLAAFRAIGRRER
jgi:hypothetical protein